tara:strand:+ start:15315 stop:15662 length:348 start_codon:yes stop_codon:yes gene_type:complete
MENEFVPYDEALALKELGFDQKCISVYLTSNKLPYPMYRPYTINEQTDELLRPLYQQAFRFLLTLLNKDKSLSNKWTISYNEDYLSLFSGGCNMGVHKKEIECIRELIKISKQTV